MKNNTKNKINDEKQEHLRKKVAYQSHAKFKPNN